MPSDTPTPAEIAAKAIESCGHGAAVWPNATARLVVAALSEHYHLLPRADGALDISTHNGAEVTPDNLRYAATHGAITASWIYDVLTGLADLIEEPK